MKIELKDNITAKDLKMIAFDMYYGWLNMSLSSCFDKYLFCKKYYGIEAQDMLNDIDAVNATVYIKEAYNLKKTIAGFSYVNVKLQVLLRDNDKLNLKTDDINILSYKDVIDGIKSGNIIVTAKAPHALKECDLASYSVVSKNVYNDYNKQLYVFGEHEYEQYNKIMKDKLSHIDDYVLYNDLKTVASLGHSKLRREVSKKEKDLIKTNDFSDLHKIMKLKVDVATLDKIVKHTNYYLNNLDKKSAKSL